MAVFETSLRTDEGQDGMTAAHRDIGLGQRHDQIFLLFKLHLGIEHALSSSREYPIKT